MEIRTDYKWKNFKYRYEVPEKVLQDQFAYQNEDEVSDGFLRYRGSWYHLDEFIRVDGHSPFPGVWHGYYADSYFSGILICVSGDNEQYQIGRYYS